MNISQQHRVSSVLFVCMQLYERPAKIAYALRLMGVETYLITSSTNYYLGWGKYFSKIITIDPSNLSTTINQFPIDTPIHHFSTLVDIFTLTLARSGRRFIFDYKDIVPGVATFMDGEVHAKLLTFILLSQNAVCYRDSQMDRFLSVYGLPEPKLYKFIPDFVWPGQENGVNRYNFTVNSRRHSAVYIGNFSIEKVEPHYSGLGQLPIVRAFLAAGMELTMFPYRHDKLHENEQAMSEYLELSRMNTAFKFRQPIEPNILAVTLARFGWGIQLHPACHIEGLSALHCYKLPFIGLAARLSDYLGAGLPLIVSEGMTDSADIVRSYEVGVIVPKNGLDEISNILSEVSYARLKRNVREYIETTISYFKVIPVLLDFYQDFVSLAALEKSPNH